MTIVGEGIVALPPDLATVSVGITMRGATADAAVAEMTQRARAVLDRLSALGIAERDRQSASLSLQPVYGDRGQDGVSVISGYEAATRVTVRVRDLEILGEVLGAVLEDGANRLGGLSFGLSEPTAAQDEARALAVADALRKARGLAKAAGVTLGPVLSIDEAGDGGGGATTFAATRADAVPNAAGETSVTARVTLVFAISQ